MLPDEGQQTRKEVAVTNFCSNVLSLSGQEWGPDDRMVASDGEKGWKGVSRACRGERRSGEERAGTEKRDGLTGTFEDGKRIGGRLDSADERRADAG